jgi:PKD repeat protein
MAALSISPAGNVTNTTVTDCIFYYSYGYDVHIEYGYKVENNTFYNNSFLSSSEKVWDERDNIWYNSILSRGNYWACYDEPSEDAYDSNSDGIIDKPYDIPGGDNQDMHPLANPEFQGLYLPVVEANGLYSAYTDASITFDATGSYDNDSPHLIYEWDLGNGDIIYGKTASYAYHLEGDYIVILTVEDDYGLTSTDTTTATITDEPTPPPPPTEPPTPPLNEAPTADAGGPYYEFTGVAILFDGSDSNDVDGTSLKYKWDFGEGGTSFSRMPTYTYLKDGNFTVTLTVTDEDGATDSDSTFTLISKKPNNPPDKPKVSGIFKGHINTSLNISVNGSDEDGDFIQYIINWSDGTNDTVSPLLENSTLFNASHNFSIGGVYVVTIWTKDQNNATSDVQKCKFIIDSHSCGTLGYLVDKDGNGIYDVFYRETTGKETRVEQDGDDYTIDINGDEKWDYIYNFNTDKVQDYSSTPSVNKEDSFILDLKWVLLIIIIGAVGIYLIASNAIFKARNGKNIPIKKKKEKIKKVKKKEKKISIITKPVKEKPEKKPNKTKSKAKKRIKIRQGKKIYAFDPKARKMKKMHKDIDRLLSEKKSTK